jgi:hypothetical protein
LAVWTTRRYRVQTTKDAPTEYEKPEITDYGTLRDLTTATSTGVSIDVPRGTPVPPFMIFSA